MPSFRGILAALIIVFVPALSKSGCVVDALAQVPAAFPVGKSSDSSWNWNDSARELAAKIVARTDAHAALILTVENMSSLGAGEAAEVRRALHAELRRQGVRLVAAERAEGKGLAARASRPALVSVALSENAQGYLWVVQIRHASEEGGMPAVLMLTVPRTGNAPAVRTPSSVVLLKHLVWEQDEPILDVAPVDPSPAARSALLVLSPSRLALVGPPADGVSETPGTVAQSAVIVHTRPWPRDARGRLVVHADRSFDAHLPGIKCHGTLEPVWTLDCRDGEDPWPVAAGPESTSAAFVAGRNFFDGHVSAVDGAEMHVRPFFSASELGASEAQARLLIFDGLDGRVRVTTSGGREIAAFEGWGSDIAAIDAECAHTRLVLADAPADPTGPDVVRAYEVTRGGSVAAGPAVEFPGPVTALWSEGEGNVVLAVSRNLEKGKYEAYSLAVSCSQ